MINIFEIETQNEPIRMDEIIVGYKTSKVRFKFDIKKVLIHTYT